MPWSWRGINVPISTPDDQPEHFHEEGIDPQGLYAVARRAMRRRRRERLMRGLVWATFAVVLVAATTLGVVEVAHHIHLNSGGAGSGDTGTGSSSSTTTSSSVPVAVPGGPPVVQAISPTQGSAGQTLTITGANLFSSDGHVQAFFGSETASTSCSSETTCTTTVPPMVGATSVPVMIKTSAGTSNSVNFTYN